MFCRRSEMRTGPPIPASRESRRVSPPGIQPHQSPHTQTVNRMLPLLLPLPAWATENTPGPVVSRPDPENDERTWHRGVRDPANRSWTNRPSVTGAPAGSLLIFPGDPEHASLCCGDAPRSLRGSRPGRAACRPVHRRCASPRPPQTTELVLSCPHVPLPNSEILNSPAGEPWFMTQHSRRLSAATEPRARLARFFRNVNARLQVTLQVMLRDRQLWLLRIAQEIPLRSRPNIDRRFHAKVSEGLANLGFNRLIHAKTTEADTPRRAVVTESTSSVVARSPRLAATTCDVRPSRAPGAAQQCGQQSRTALCGIRPGQANQQSTARTPASSRSATWRRM